MATRPSVFFLTITLFVFLVSPLQPSINPQESSLPYIYYYADTLKSLVIERVDGSDSRVLTELPYSLIRSFDWSPSGEWVAWLNGQWNGPGNVKLRPWIMRSDGSERCHQLDDANDVIFMQWSPTEDVLYVADRLDFSGIRLLLVDVSANKVLAQFIYENPSAADFEFPPPSSWSRDGQQVYVVIFALDTQTLVTLSPDGTVHARVFGGPREYNLGDFTRGRALYITRRQQDDYDPRLIMQDVTSGREVVLLADDPEVDGDAYWNDDLTYALVRLRWFNDDRRVVRTEYHLLDWVDGTVIPLADTLAVQPDDSYIRLSDTLWSGNGRFATLSDGEGNLSVLNAETGDIHTVEVENAIDWHWSTSGVTLWLQAGQEDPNDSMAYRYEPESRVIARVPALDGGYAESWFQFSPDGKIVARLPGVLNSLIHVETGEAIPLIHHSLAQAGMQLFGVVWYPSGDWYMTGEHVFYAGGGGGPEAITLYSRDGTLRRELGLCFSYSTCAGFVPERAAPYLGNGQAQSVVDEPVLTLKHDKRILGVAWSPNENLLAAYGLSRSSDVEATLTIWRVNDNEAHEVETYPVDVVCSQYPGSCLMTWRDDNTILFDNQFRAAWVLDLITREAQPIPSAYYKLSPDGLYRVECYDSKFTIVDIERDQIVVEVEREEDVNSGFLLSHWLPEGHTLLVQRYDGRILRWDGTSIQPIGSGAVMWGYAYHEQAELMATGSLYSRVSIIDIGAGEHLTDINWASSALAFNADGSLLAAGGTELVSIWDMTRYHH